MKNLFRPTVAPRALLHWIAQPSLAMVTAAALHMGAYAASTPDGAQLQLEAAPADTARDEAAQSELEYARLDQQVAARDGRRQWAPPMELRRAAQAAWPQAVVGESACGVEVCRVHISHNEPDFVNDFLRKLLDLQDSAGGPQSTAGIVIRYYDDKPLDLTIYLLMPEAPAAQKVGSAASSR